MNRYAVRSSRCSSASRLRIAACTDTSSADVGSSQTTSLRVAGEGAGDGDALLEPARQRRRPHREEAVGQLHRPGQVEQLLLARAAGQPCQLGQGAADDHPHRVPAVERRVRVLEHDLDRPHLLRRPLAGGRRQRLPVELEHAALVARRDAEQHAGERRLAAARLADQAQRLARPDLRGHVGQRVHVVAATGGTSWPARRRGAAAGPPRARAASASRAPPRGAASARARGSGSGCRGRGRRRTAAAARCGSGPRPARSGRRTRNPAGRRPARAGSRGSCPAGACPCAGRPWGCSAAAPPCRGGGDRRTPGAQGLPRPACRRRGRRRVSHILAITARLWLMNSTELSNSVRRAATRSSTSDSTVASRPVVGSSRISSAGFGASAIAITTRCCMPPDSWCG